MLQKYELSPDGNQLFGLDIILSVASGRINSEQMKKVEELIENIYFSEETVATKDSDATVLYQNNNHKSTNF